MPKTIGDTTFTLVEGVQNTRSVEGGENLTKSVKEDFGTTLLDRSFVLIKAEKESGEKVLLGGYKSEGDGKPVTITHTSHNGQNYKLSSPIKVEFDDEGGYGKVKGEITHESAMLLREKMPNLNLAHYEGKVTLFGKDDFIKYGLNDSKAGDATYAVIVSDQEKGGRQAVLFGKMDGDVFVSDSITYKDGKTAAFAKNVDMTDSGKNAGGDVISKFEFSDHVNYTNKMETLMAQAKHMETSTIPKAPADQSISKGR